VSDRSTRNGELGRAARSGGIMMSGGVHDFETMRTLVGELASVQALRAPQRFPEMEGDGARKCYSEALNGARTVQDALEAIKGHAAATLQ
jgi:hypothetical protein